MFSAFSVRYNKERSPESNIMLENFLKLSKAAWDVDRKFVIFIYNQGQNTFTLLETSFFLRFSFCVQRQ